MTDPPLVPVAGLAGLANTISWVIATDHFDPKKWLRGGEFNLISGWNIGNDRREMALYLDRLYSAGVAGIGFGVGLKFDAIPQPLIDRANMLGLPVCEVPYDLGFSKITQVAAESILAEREFRQKRFLKSQAVEDAIDDRITVYDIAARISGTLAAEASFISRYDGLIARFPGGSSDRNTRQDFPAEHPRMVFPCTDEVTLEVCRPEQVFSEMENTFISEMLLACRILLKKDAAVIRERARLQIDLLHEISASTNAPEGLARKFTVLGLDPARKYMVVAVNVGLNKVSAVSGIMRRVIPANVLLGIDSGYVIFLVPAGRRKDDTSGMLDTLAKEMPDVTIGVSALSPIERLSIAVRQARALSRLRGPGIRRPEDMDLEGLLMLIDPIISKDFICSVLTEKLPPELRTSIEALFEHGFNINRTAAALDLHRHTMKSRIERFVDITGIDINTADNRNKAWLALKLVRLLEGRA